MSLIDLIKDVLSDVLRRKRIEVYCQNCNENITDLGGFITQNEAKASYFNAKMKPLLS